MRQNMFFPPAYELDQTSPRQSNEWRFAIRLLFIHVQRLKISSIKRAASRWVLSQRSFWSTCMLNLGVRVQHHCDYPSEPLSQSSSRCPSDLRSVWKQTFWSCCFLSRWCCWFKWYLWNEFEGSDKCCDERLRLLFQLHVDITIKSSRTPTIFYYCFHWVRDTHNFFFSFVAFISWSSEQVRSQHYSRLLLMLFVLAIVVRLPQLELTKKSSARISWSTSSSREAGGRSERRTRSYDISTPKHDQFHTRSLTEEKLVEITSSRIDWMLEAAWTTLSNQEISWVSLTNNALSSNLGTRLIVLAFTIWEK